jgi:sulfate permease, SulP family
MEMRKRLILMADIHVSVRNDLKGALSAAIITLPMAIAYGITAFAALGPDFRPTAALIGVNAAIIIFVGFGLFDRTTIHLLNALKTPGTFRKDIGISLLVNISVAVITVSVNLVAAVIIGLAISAAYFIAKTGAQVIRREYTAERVSSNKTRDLRISAILKENGRRIIVFELQGPIFFGSADRLAHRIEAATDGATFCILDMKQVNEIDSTGAHILIRLHNILNQKAKRLLISHIAVTDSIWGILEVSGVTRVIPGRHFFEDTDQALEWAEDRLLEDLGACAANRHYDLPQLDLLGGFEPEELAVFRESLKRATIKKRRTDHPGRRARSQYVSAHPRFGKH